MIDIQYNITIIGGHEVSRPYRVWFFAEGERFYPFGDATDLAGEGVFYVFVSVPPVFIHCPPTSNGTIENPWGK